MNLMTLEDRLARIEEALKLLVEQRAEKEFYTTAEAAKILGKAEFTVREWARLGRISAKKRLSSNEWIISHDELERVKNHGLLPDTSRYRHVK